MLIRDTWLEAYVCDVSDAAPGWVFNDNLIMKNKCVDFSFIAYQMWTIFPFLRNNYLQYVFLLIYQIVVIVRRPAYFKGA